MRILAGDIGGTNTRLAFFETEGSDLQILTETTLPSREYPTLEAALWQFKQSTGLSSDRCCLGVPGPVRDGRARITNLPWEVDAAKISAMLQEQPVWVINDLEAGAYGIPTLHEGDTVLINPGAPDAYGNAAIISPGTGLGEAGMYWDGERHRPFATEGGHTDFSPTRDIDVALLAFMRERYEHVSWERLVSGPGLVNLYDFLCRNLEAETPSWLAEQMRQGDPAAAISEAAASNRCPVCNEALELFTYCFGVEAGNLALKVMATGGVYLGGGITPRILDRLRGPAFMEGFRAKGRMSDLVSQMPVRALLVTNSALRGSAYYAATALA